MTVLAPEGGSLGVVVYYPDFPEPRRPRDTRIRASLIWPVQQHRGHEVIEQLARGQDSRVHPFATWNPFHGA